jgi:hypothetical protein
VKINFLHLLGVTNTRSQTHFIICTPTHRRPRPHTQYTRSRSRAAGIEKNSKKIPAGHCSIQMSNARISMRAATTKSKSDPYCARRSFILFKKAVKFPFLCVFSPMSTKAALFAYTRGARCAAAASRAHFCFFSV